MSKEVIFNIRINVQQEKELDRLKQRMDFLIAKQREHKNLTKAETVELKAVRKEYNALNTTLAKQAGLQTTQANTLGRVNAQLAIERQRIKDVVIGSQGFKTIANRIKELETRQRQYNAAIGRGTTFVGEYARGAITAFRNMAAGIMSVVIAFRTFSRIFKSTIKTLEEFEQGQMNVQTLLEDFDAQLAGESIDLMRKYGLEIDDMNKALFDAVSAGVEVRRSIEFLDEAAILATAGVSDMKSVVDGMTTVMNVWNVSMEDMNKVSAAFFSAQKKGKFYVADITAEIGKVASIAKVANLSYQELMSTYAEMTKRGLRLEDSTTAIKAAILAVSKPSEQAKEVFGRLQIQTGLNAVANQGLFTILKKINSATETDKDLLTELIPNVRALTGVTVLNKEALEDYSKILKIVNEDYGEGSSMMKAYILQMETLTFKQKKLRAAWDAFILTIKSTKELTELYGGALEGLTIGIGALNEELVEEESWFNKIKKQVKTAIIDSTKLGSAILNIAFALRLFNKEAKETVDLVPKIGEMEERLAQVAKEEADRLAAEAEALRKIEEEKQKAEEARKQRLEAEKKDWEEKFLMITEEQEIKKADAEFDKWQADWVLGNIIAEKEAREAAANAEREANESRMAQEEEDRKTRAENRQKELEDEFKMIADRIAIFKDFASGVGVIIEDVLSDQEKGIKEFSKQLILIGLKSLKAVADMAVAESIMRSMASAESVATWGLAGLAKSAILITAIESAYGIARGIILAKMAKGGTVPGYGDKDTVPIMATPKEGVINARSMASQDVMTLTGRPFDIASQINSYKGFGIPFHTGGVVPSNTYNQTYNQFDESTINRIIGAINAREIKVYQNVNEVISAQNEIKVTQQTSEL